MFPIQGVEPRSHFVNPGRDRAIASRFLLWACKAPWTEQLDGDNGTSSSRLHDYLSIVNMKVFFGSVFRLKKALP